MAEPTQDWSRYLGRKISVRYRIHGDPRHSFSEAVGVVMSVGPDESGVVWVRVLKRSGEVALVPVPDVVAAKVIS